MWLTGYAVNRESTVRQARTHARLIENEFGHMPLSAVRPSQVKAWVAELHADDPETSYIYASAHTTLDTYGHLWPDADESTRTAIGVVIAERMKTTGNRLRTKAPNA